MADLPPLPACIAFMDESPAKRKKKIRTRADKTPKWPKRGRPPVHALYPTVVPSAERCINENRFQADRHRQSDTGLCGVTSKQVRDELFTNIPGLQDERPNLSK